MLAYSTLMVLCAFACVVASVLGSSQAIHEEEQAGYGIGEKSLIDAPRRGFYSGVSSESIQSRLHATHNAHCIRCCSYMWLRDVAAPCEEVQGTLEGVANAALARARCGGRGRLCTIGAKAYSCLKV